MSGPVAKSRAVATAAIFVNGAALLGAGAGMIDAVLHGWRPLGLGAPDVLLAPLMLLAGGGFLVYAGLFRMRSVPKRAAMLRSGINLQAQHAMKKDASGYRIEAARSVSDRAMLWAGSALIAAPRAMIFGVLILFIVQQTGHQPIIGRFLHTLTRLLPRDAIFTVLAILLFTMSALGRMLQRRAMRTNNA